MVLLSIFRQHWEAGKGWQKRPSARPEKEDIPEDDGWQNMARENAMASVGTDGVGPGFVKLWDWITIMEFDITGPESAAGSIGPINVQMKLTE